MATSLIPLSSSFLQPLKFKTLAKPRTPPNLSTTRKITTTCDSQNKNTGASSNPSSRNPNFQKRRKSSKYGTSRRSILKKSFLQEQVTFTARVSEDPQVAIIGGGMAGLVCALNLEARGVKSTVFDTVRLLGTPLDCFSILNSQLGFWVSRKFRSLCVFCCNFTSNSSSFLG